MPSSTAAPPSPRQLLTSLIEQISRIPLDPEPQAHDSELATARRRGERVGVSSNALSRVPLEHRRLIITMHVLFPGLVLPALDLLDRSLVTRVTLELGQREPSSEAGDAAKETGKDPAIGRRRG